jgi:hypothetical protein
LLQFTKRYCSKSSFSPWHAASGAKEPTINKTLVQRQMQRLYYPELTSNYPCEIFCFDCHTLIILYSTITSYNLVRLCCEYHAWYITLQQHGMMVFFWFLNSSSPKRRLQCHHSQDRQAGKLVSRAGDGFDCSVRNLVHTFSNPITMLRVW